MKYYLTSLILAHVSLFGWSDHTSPAMQERMQTPQVSNFPYADDQGWFVDPSYLLWKPFMGNMDYGLRVDSGLSVNLTPGNFTLGFDDKVRVKKPRFEWDSGVRVGIGRYLPNHDKWDISFYSTYFYGDTETRRSTSGANVGFSPNFFTSFILVSVPQVSSRWQLNYFTFDLMLGRNFLATSKIVFHPYFGIRETSQYQKAKNQYELEEVIGGAQLISSYTQKGYNEYWGVGPKVGTHFAYYFQTHWSFIGNFAASVVLGQQKLKQRADLFASDSADLAATLEQTYKSKDSLKAIRANIEGSLGLSWERWLKNNSVRIAPSVLFEGAMWYAMNQLWNIWPPNGNNLIGDQFNNLSTRKRGNLGLIGLTFDLQIDF